MQLDKLIIIIIYIDCVRQTADTTSPFKLKRIEGVGVETAQERNARAAAFRQYSLSRSFRNMYAKKKYSYAIIYMVIILILFICLKPNNP